MTPQSEAVEHDGLVADGEAALRAMSVYMLRVIVPVLVLRSRPHDARPAPGRPRLRVVQNE